VESSRSADTADDLDSEPSGSGGGAFAPGGQEASRRDDCIIKFVAEAMKIPDPLAANLGVITGDLLGIASVMARAVSEVMAQTDDAASAVAETQAIVHDYLRVTKQVDRFFQLQLALRK
jgi:hypothetical protein